MFLGFNNSAIEMSLLFSDGESPFFRGSINQLEEIATTPCQA